ncbi:hypothetical protein AAY473_034220, partial [Plecturocebus cupreus]
MESISAAPEEGKRRGLWAPFLLAPFPEESRPRRLRGTVTAPRDPKPCRRPQSTSFAVLPRLECSSVVSAHCNHFLKRFSCRSLQSRYVEKHCHVVITHVSKFAMLVLVENVLDLGKGSVHVRNQKMYQLVEIVVIKYLNVESIDVHSVVTEVLVKHVD